MKRLLFWMIVVGVVVGGGAVGYRRLRPAADGADNGGYRTAPVRRGDITFTVKESGAVQPVQSVQVGSFVSGPICHIYVDFNDKVKKGQLLAEVDPLIFKANLDQAKASLAAAKANLLQAKAKLEQTERDWMRAQSLLPTKAISDTDYDLAKSLYETAAANVALCEAQIQQNEAALELAKANLGYTKITSPVDGIVTDRKVDPGQTLASAYQTPVLFVVAPDLEKRVYVLASVDEADIGLIREAQVRRQPVTFRVDAYPKDTFEGKTLQIRLTPTTVQNVVTYTVVVEASNPQLKLLPGMTPTLSFQIQKHTGVLKIPNAALRFDPKPELVRACDRPILEGRASDGQEKQDADPSPAAAADGGPSSEPARKEQFVWLSDGDLLSAVKVVTGLSDDKFTELVSGDLKEGQTLVTGMKSR